MKNIYVSCGISGSGKSTAIRSMIDKSTENTVYLNADTIREELYGDASVQGDPAKVFGLLFSRYEIALKDKDVRRIYVDNTSLTVKDRRKYWAMAKEFCVEEFKFNLMFFVPDLETAKVLNKRREKQVPDEVIERQFFRIQRPSEWEYDNYNVMDILSVGV